MSGREKRKEGGSEGIFIVMNEEHKEHGKRRDDVEKKTSKKER